MNGKRLLVLIPMVLLSSCSWNGTRTTKTYMSRQYTYIGATLYEDGFDKKESYPAEKYISKDKKDTYLNFKYDGSFEWNIGYLDQSIKYNVKGTYYESNGYVHMFNEDGSLFMDVLATLPSSINGYAGINSIRLEHNLIINVETKETVHIHIWGVGEFDKPHIWE